MFEVVKGASSDGFNVVCTKNPAVGNTSFVINHNRVNSDISVTLDVFDLSGRQLWHHTESGLATGNTYTLDWNLTIDGGSRMQTGVYLCRFQLDGGDSKTVKLIVISNN